MHGGGRPAWADARGRATAAVGLVALVLALHLRWPVGVVGQGTYLFCTLGAGVVALVSARRLPAAAARPWRWVALGLLSSAVGDAYYALHAELAPPVPGVSAADPGWLLSYVFLIAAMLVLLRDRRVGIRSDIEGLIDTAMAIVVSCLVLWQLAVQPVLSDPAISSLTRIVWAAYPVLDAVLLAVVLRVILSRRAISSVGGLLACGTVCWMAADLTSMFVEWDGAALRAMDAAWMVGPVLIAGGAWRAGAAPPTRAGGSRRASLRRGHSPARAGVVARPDSHPAVGAGSARAPRRPPRG